MIDVVNLILDDIVRRVMPEFWPWRESSDPDILFLIESGGHRMTTSVLSALTVWILLNVALLLKILTLKPLPIKRRDPRSISAFSRNLSSHIM